MDYEHSDKYVMYRLCTFGLLALNKHTWNVLYTVLLHVIRLSVILLNVMAELPRPLLLPPFSSSSMELKKTKREQAMIQRRRKRKKYVLSILQQKRKCFNLY
jgi:hypothetical protein